ncbi:MAG: hypothetical protein LBS86_06470 [Treponema sp.]|jgi:hypothetical protein|nr:hypothetical protein [Treponema sp.]
MAIQPIDLQTLFTQVDKVGKEQAANKDGAALQQALHGAQTQRKNDARIQSVNETQDMGYGMEAVKDRNPSKHQRGESFDRRDDEPEPEPDDGVEIIRDPALGKHIDVSG